MTICLKAVLVPVFTRPCCVIILRILTPAELPLMLVQRAELSALHREETRAEE